MNHMIDKLDVKYMFGVGYAFDILSGKASRTPKIIQKIGEEFSLTRERVRQIKEKAIRRLRHRSRSKILRTYLG